MARHGYQTHLVEDAIALLSIHAPARGAMSGPRTARRSPSFQSTLPHGERYAVSIGRILRKYFQSTLPHGERSIETRYIFWVYLFQSTLPHGERLTPLYVSVFTISFQSTLPHGERFHSCRPPAHLVLSIHAPARGAIILSAILALGEVLSIHAPARGAISMRGWYSLHLIFQSTLPHGERSQ